MYAGQKLADDLKQGHGDLEERRRQKSAVPSVCNLADELHPFLNIHHTPGEVMRVRGPRNGMVGWFGAYGSAARGLGTVDEFDQDLNNCIVNSSLERPYQV